MKFVFVGDDLEIGIYEKQVSEDGRVWVGISPVLYGYRIRAGYTVDKIGCALDWCAGANPSDVSRLYSIILAILSKRDDVADCFYDIPGASTIKPFYRDHQFTKTILTLAGSGLVLHDVCVSEISRKQNEALFLYDWNMIDEPVSE